MFRRELKTKLPKLCPNKSVLDENIRDLDWNHKLSRKFYMYADKQRMAPFNPVARLTRFGLKTLNHLVSWLQILNLSHTQSRPRKDKNYLES